MGNADVRDARQDAKEARIQEKVDRIREDIPDDEEDDSDAGSGLASITANGGRVSIPDGRGGFIELVSYAQYQIDMAKARKDGEAIKRFRMGANKARKALKRYIDKMVREVAQGADELHGRQGRLGQAQADTHHELTRYRDDFGGIFSTIAAPLSSLMKNVNREDAANVWALTLADTIRSYKTSMPESGQLVDIIALIAEFFAYYDPAKGISSVFTQDYDVVRVPVGTVLPPAAANAGVTLLA